MAVEHYFVSSAIMTLAIMGTFLYLYHSTRRDSLWRTIWLLGTFAFMAYGLAIQRFGWQYGAVANSLDEMTFGVLLWTIYGIYLLCAFLMFQLVMAMFKALMAAATGKAEFGKTDMGKGYGKTSDSEHQNI